MARFTVRVELRNGADAATYTKLNRAMEAKGFSRLVQVGSGRQYRLPAAEFRMASRRGRAHVRTLARQGAAALGTPCSILVTEGPCCWYNLEDA